MDSLKLIPSVFFDAIARVVPGATAIVAYLLISGRTWSQILENTLGPPFAESDSLLTATGLLLFSAYVVGQLIAPFAKLAKRIGKWKWFDKPEAPHDAYDYLRLHYKDAGSQCAKIRAEFTMYNGLATVFFASSVSYLMFTSIREWRVLIILLGTTLATGIRDRTTRDTFEQTVIKFVKPTPFPKSPAAQRDAPPNGGLATPVGNSGVPEGPPSVS
jgi:hypothetical protein